MFFWHFKASHKTFYRYWFGDIPHKMCAWNPNHCWVCFVWACLVDALGHSYVGKFCTFGSHQTPLIYGLRFRNLMYGIWCSCAFFFCWENIDFTWNLIDFWRKIPISVEIPHAKIMIFFDRSPISTTIPEIPVKIGEVRSVFEPPKNRRCPEIEVPPVLIHFFRLSMK